jgi:hypothetical protein
MRRIVIYDLVVQGDGAGGTVQVGYAIFWNHVPPTRVRSAPSFSSLLPTATNYAVWTASTAVTQGTEQVPSTPNGLAYKCTTPGTTGPTPPTWPTGAFGQTVTDGTVVWTLNAQDLNGGCTAVELQILQAGILVESPQVSSPQANLAAIEAEFVARYTSMQSNLNSSASASVPLGISWDGTTWSNST